MISIITITEYLLVFSDSRTAFSDACIRQASECGRMYCKRSGDVYLGFLCTGFEGETERILYAYTKPEFRGKGVFTSLAEHVVHTTNMDVSIIVPEQHLFFAEVDAVSRRLGFTPTESLHTFSFDRSWEAAWHRIKEIQRFDSCCALLQRNGYKAVPFAEADENILWQIEYSHSSSFCNPLDPSAFFRLMSKKLNMELSCAAVKDEKVLAYTLLSQPSKSSVVLEQMASSADTRELGVILLPFVYSVDSFFESDCNRWAFAIYPSNTATNKIRMTLEKEIAFDEKVTRHYRKGREQG